MQYDNLAHAQRLMNQYADELELRAAKDQAFRMAQAARHQGTPDEFPDVEVMMTPSDLLRLVNFARAEERRACDEAVDAWRTIDSAPKDGTEIDVWCPEVCPPDNGYRIARVWWSKVDNRFRSYSDNMVAWAHQPSHWMPIPAGPKEAKT